MTEFKNTKDNFFESDSSVAISREDTIVVVTQYSANGHSPGIQNRDRIYRFSDCHSAVVVLSGPKEISGINIESLLRRYEKSRLKTRHASLESYVNSFRVFLAREGALRHTEHEANNVKRLAAIYAQEITAYAQWLADLGEKDATSGIDETIEEACETMLRKSPQATDRFKVTPRQSEQYEAIKLVCHAQANLTGISPEATAKIANCIFQIIADARVSQGAAKLVFAGMGYADNEPSAIAVFFDGFVSSQALLYREKCLPKQVHQPVHMIEFGDRADASYAVMSLHPYPFDDIIDHMRADLESAKLPGTAEKERSETLSWLEDAIYLGSRNVQTLDRAKLVSAFIATVPPRGLVHFAKEVLSFSFLKGRMINATPDDVSIVDVAIITRDGGVQFESEVIEHGKRSNSSTEQRLAA